MLRPIAVILPFLILAGCTQPPEPTLYVMSQAAGAEDATDPVVAVLRVKLPDYLDRPQMVSRNGANALVVNENDRWGEPLDRGVLRVLCQDLSNHLPGARVVPPQEARGQPLRYEYGVVLDAYEPDGSGNMVIRGRWRLHDIRTGRVLADGLIDDRAPLAAGDTPSVVSAMNQGLDMVGRQIAEATAETVGRH